MLLLLQGRGHTRVKDSEEEESIVPDGSHCSEDKGCEKYDSSDKHGASAVLPEEPLGSDDRRPLKKSKSDIDERNSSNDLNNGCHCENVAG